MSFTTLEKILGVVISRELLESSTPAVVMSAAWQAWGLEESWVTRGSAGTELSGFFKESLEQVSALLATADRITDTHPGVAVDSMCRQILDNDISEDVVLPHARRRGV
jgi:hypothetical protein